MPGAMNPAFLVESPADSPHARFGPMRILVAHNVPRGRNGGMNRIMALFMTRSKPPVILWNIFVRRMLGAPANWRGSPFH